MCDFNNMMRDSRCTSCKQSRGFDVDCPKCVLKSKWMQRVDQLRQQAAGPVCGTVGCELQVELEEDRDNPGTFYCNHCWTAWELEQQYAHAQCGILCFRSGPPVPTIPLKTIVPAGTSLQSVVTNTGTDDFAVFEDPTEREAGKPSIALGSKEKHKKEDRRFGAVLRICEFQNESAGDLSPLAGPQAPITTALDVTADDKKRSWHRQQPEAHRKAHGTYSKKQQKHAGRLSPRSPTHDENSPQHDFSQAHLCSASSHDSSKPKTLPPPGFGFMEQQQHTHVW